MLFIKVQYNVILVSDYKKNTNIYLKNNKPLDLTQDTSIVIYFPVNCIIMLQTTRENTLTQVAYQSMAFWIATNRMSKAEVITK